MDTIDEGKSNRHVAVTSKSPLLFLRFLTSFRRVRSESSVWFLPQT